MNLKISFFLLKIFCFSFFTSSAAGETNITMMCPEGFKAYGQAWYGSDSSKFKVGIITLNQTKFIKEQGFMIDAKVYHIDQVSISYNFL